MTTLSCPAMANTPATQDINKVQEIKYSWDSPTAIVPPDKVLDLYHFSAHPRSPVLLGERVKANSENAYISASGLPVDNSGNATTELTELATAHTTDSADSADQLPHPAIMCVDTSSCSALRPDAQPFVPSNTAKIEHLSRDVQTFSVADSDSHASTQNLVDFDDEFLDERCNTVDVYNRIHHHNSCSNHRLISKERQLLLQDFDIGLHVCCHRDQCLQTTYDLISFDDETSVKQCESNQINTLEPTLHDRVDQIIQEFVKQHEKTFSNADKHVTFSPKVEYYLIDKL